MSDAEYIELQGDAKEILAEFGAPATWRIFNLSTGALVATHTPLMVKVDEVRHVLGTSEIEIGDWVCLMEHIDGAVPLHGQRVTFNGEDRVMVAPKPIQPAGIVVCWYVWLRKG